MWSPFSLDDCFRFVCGHLVHFAKFPKCSFSKCYLIFPIFHPLSINLNIHHKYGNQGGTDFLGVVCEKLTALNHFISPMSIRFSLVSQEVKNVKAPGPLVMYKNRPICILEISYEEVMESKQ